MGKWYVIIIGIANLLIAAGLEFHPYENINVSIALCIIGGLFLLIGIVGFFIDKGWSPKLLRIRNSSNYPQPMLKYAGSDLQARNYRLNQTESSRSLHFNYIKFKNESNTIKAAVAHMVYWSKRNKNIVWEGVGKWANNGPDNFELMSSIDIIGNGEPYLLYTIMDDMNKVTCEIYDNSTAQFYYGDEASLRDRKIKPREYVLLMVQIKGENYISDKFYFEIKAYPYGSTTTLIQNPDMDEYQIP